MKTTQNLFFAVFFAPILFVACSKKEPVSEIPNSTPIIALRNEIKQIQPFTYEFIASARDDDGDKLTYSWDFGEGTSRNGDSVQRFTYPDNRSYIITVKVSDGKTSVSTTNSVSTQVTDVVIDENKSFQQILGLGGYFSNTTRLNDLINDLGVSIIRDEVPPSLEYINDNNDPNNTDLSKFNIIGEVPEYGNNLGSKLETYRSLKASGIKTFIASVWSPPGWMKHNKRVNNGTIDKSIETAYTLLPDSSSNQLKTEYYDEFAELCVAYVKILKRETGIDLYALSISNEPRFSSSYQSCVYSGDALKTLIKVVGKRFIDEGLSTKLVLPEDFGSAQKMEPIVKPILDDPSTLAYIDAIAYKGYEYDPYTPEITSIPKWQTMSGWAKTANKSLWMTETWGFANNYTAASGMSYAIIQGMKYGGLNAWLYFQMTGNTIEPYTLMDEAGNKSRRYFVLKQFFHFIRPGAVRFETSADENELFYTVGFKNPDNRQSIIFLNQSDQDKFIRIKGTGVRSTYEYHITAELKNCSYSGDFDPQKGITIPKKSTVTLYSK